MERDSHRTFREIHGSKENLVSSVKDILEKALVEVVEDDAPLNLRFITPYQITTGWPTDENCSDYALTLPGELPPGQEYISVSYTWAHSQEIDASKPISDYRIKDRATPDAPFRSINCPTMIFHRAWCFARAHKIPYIWIDQECIYQGNAEDKQRHLQIMDKIYKRSKWTVAVLSTELPDTMLSALALILQYSHQRLSCPNFGDWPGGIDIRPLYDEFKKNAVKILSSLYSDRWFTRAWTFQERRCASACVLLAPVGNKSDAVAQLSLDWIGSDVSFSFRHIFILMNPPNVCTQYHADNVHEVLVESFYHGGDLSGRSANWLLFRAMERCDSLICSDRLTIFANVCSFRYKLNSTVLNDAKYSYSTCMLALIMANEVEDKLTVDSTETSRSDVDLDQNFEWYLGRKQWSLDAKRAK
ncbi:hypothetical protein GT037_008895 [Alternaria burnsii]|uniref:Heterokaryon incompatibility domain-containing protein n=1 Tax=Alternaria burnsii TaxID=1187904 RepID=A0A8H7B0U4_9PLEO|nr:uncharacterized protein GT037_008895 [Alternaria burnsii]KAF7672944.1 hypothetical protein GT037_008895 [Alternaria burnsii]